MEFLTSILKHFKYSDHIPEGYDYIFTPGMFHQPNHLSLQGKRYLPFFVLNTNKKKVVAHIFFLLNDQHAYSPLKASYGGMEFNPNLDLKILWEFETYFTTELREKNIKSVLITLPPAIYNLTIHTKQFIVFQNKGYKLVKAEPGASIPITKRKFNSVLDYEIRRKMRLSYKAGLEFQKEGNEKIESYYNFIMEARSKKNQSVSMTWDQLKSTVNVFDKNFLLFGVYQGTRLVCAAITIRVTDQTLYNFYSAHDEEFSFCSPVVVLFENIYNYCRETGITLFDLGTSSLDKKPNFSLLHFKEHVGAVLSPKVTFVKKLL